MSVTRLRRTSQLPLYFVPFSQCIDSFERLVSRSYHVQASEQSYKSYSGLHIHATSRLEASHAVRRFWLRWERRVRTVNAKKARRVFVRYLSII